MFENRIQLNSWLISGRIHLSKKDYGFFNNLAHQIHDRKPITSNQSKLFDKLLAKYQRQLSKSGYSVEKLTSLKWDHEVIDTRQEFLDARISLVDGYLEIKSPFNTSFVQNFRKVPNNTFTWEKTKRVYRSNFYSFSLKMAIDNVTKYYDSMKLCPELEEILSSTEPLQNHTYWEPTLVKVHNHFYIYGINNSLYEATKDIVLNDDPRTLFLLSQYGIKIHESITNNNKLLTFASSYHTTIDLDDLENLVDYLKNLDVNEVLVGRDLVHNKKIIHELLDKFKQNGINPITSLVDAKQRIVSLHNHRVDSFLDKRNIAKTIVLTNSRPIEVT